MAVENDVSSPDNGIPIFDGADGLLDLNLFYIRQIGASLRKHVGIQDKLEREIKLKDGASRMLGACTHEDQLLEVAKTLHTSNARMYTYMAELQKLKTAEIMEKVMDEEGIQNESKVCTGRLAVSDIRIPLMWNDPERFSGGKVKEAARFAVFCLVRVGGEVQDTELVCMDKTTTDLSFRDILVFEDATHNFKLDIEIYAFPMSDESICAPTPQKLLSRLNRSIGKSEGKRIRDRLKECPAANMKMGPQYEKLGYLALNLTHVDDHIKSHDIRRVPSTTCASSRSKPLLPLYGSLTCRLVAQPKCITEKCVTGFLDCMEVGNGPPCWSYMWCEARAGKLQCWLNPEDAASKKPQSSIDLIVPDIKINEIEKNRQKRPHSFQVRDLVNRHMFSANSKDEMTRWIKSLRQHKSDYAAWSVACISENDGAQPMFIASPSPYKSPTHLLFDNSARKTLIYDQMSIESPTDATPPPLGVAMLGSDQSTPLAGLFNGGLNRSVTKVTKLKDVQNIQTKDSQSVKKSRNRTKSNDSMTSSGKLSKHKKEDQKPPVPLRPSEDVIKDRKKLYVKSPITVKPIPKIEDLKSCYTSESCSETGLSDFCQSSDDVFLSSDDNILDTPLRRKKSTQLLTTKVKGKKKRRAPQPPSDPSGSRVDLVNGDVRSKSHASLSSASSLDDILENRHESRKPPRPVASNSYHVSPTISKPASMYNQFSDPEGRKSQLSLASNSTQVSNTSSGYKSDSEGLMTISVSHDKVASVQSECEIIVTDHHVKSKLKGRTGVKVLPTELPIGVKLTPKKFTRSQSWDSDTVLRSTSSDAANHSSDETCRTRFCSTPTFNSRGSSSKPPPMPKPNSVPKLPTKNLKSPIGYAPPSSRPIPAPRRSYLNAVESSKGKPYSTPLYDVPDSPPMEHGTTKYNLRDRKVEDIYAVPIPKSLRQSSNSVICEDEEPVYAQVDKTKKSKRQDCSNSKRTISVDAYTKAHKAIITVCKQRMEEEEEKVRRNSEEDIVYI